MLSLYCVAVFFFLTKCSTEDLPWWKTAVVYQVYPRSFKDSNGDGIGDLNGILEKADYFKDIGVTAVWLCPIFKSPMVDYGYDISNYIEIDPMFGTMADFDALVKKFKQLGIKILLDFVPNHTSDEHDWFNKSLTDPDYYDFYVWMDPKEWANGTPIPPNNWKSMFGGAAWEWREERQKFYLHQFSKKQPDLNFRSPRVWGNVTEVLKFWIDKGVDGIRLDAAKHIYENGSFPDEPVIPGTKGETFDEQLHIYEQNQPETYDLIEYWASYLYNRDLSDGQKRVLFIETYDSHAYVMRYYENGNGSLVVPFNFDLLGAGSQSVRPTILKQVIDNWMQDMPPGQPANWVVGNHDNERIADRYGSEMVDAVNLLTGVLPGIKVTYYGEEIGMQDTFVRDDQIVDHSGVKLGPFYTRDPARTPMQWDSTPSSGFSDNKNTWLPVNPNYWWLNVEAQKTAEKSHLKVFQAMFKARNDDVLQRGDLDVLVPDNNTLVVVRYYNASYVILIINMGSRETTYTSDNLFIRYRLDMDMTVVAGSINSGYSTGDTVKKRLISLTLRPKAAVVLKSTDNSPSSTTTPRLSTTISVLVLLLTIFWR